MSDHPIIVQKYGGVCLETPARIRAVASSLADLHCRGHRVVAIVSAMGKTTDELIEIARQVSPHPNRRAQHLKQNQLFWPQLLASSFTAGTKRTSVR